MRPVTPKQVFRRAVRQLVRECNKELKIGRRLVKLNSSTCKDVLAKALKKFNKAGWYTKVRGGNGTEPIPSYINFRTEPFTDDSVVQSLECISPQPS